MGKKKDWSIYVGKTFSRITVKGISRRQAPGWNQPIFLCQCLCGQEFSTRADIVLMGDAGSCGCLGRERRKAAGMPAVTTHGHTINRKLSKEYVAWQSMKRRCAGGVEVTSIWILTINKVEPDPPMIASNFIARRSAKAVEYFSSRTGAETRKDEIYQGLKKLVGFIEGVEVEIKEVQVNP